MQSNPSGPDDDPHSPPLAVPEGPDAVASWRPSDRGESIREAAARLAWALRKNVLPRLSLSCKELPSMIRSPLEEHEIEAFADALLTGDEDTPCAWVESLLARGCTAESLFMDLLAPTARYLGELWVEDCADPATVTFGVGRLHRLMRYLGPGFESEADAPSNGRRILLATPEGEQHLFGLAMLAEFFRRDGWEVAGGPAGPDEDLAQRLRDEWFDVLGLSVGSESRLPWLRTRIAHLRSLSRNRGLIVMVGGPIFTLHPHWVYEVGADATADAAAAPRLAEKMLGKGRLLRDRRRAPPLDAESATS
jgi:methanogenic corrinoid protein MtbC1